MHWLLLKEEPGTTAGGVLCAEETWWGKTAAAREWREGFRLGWVLPGSQQVLNVH